MNSRDFCFWLQGYLELAGVGPMDNLTSAQTESIQKHLNLVFKHEIDPSMGPKAHQDALNEIHDIKISKPGRDPVLLRC